MALIAYETSSTPNMAMPRRRGLVRGRFHELPCDCFAFYLSTEVPVQNLIARPKYHAGPRLNVFQRFPEVAEPMRYAHDVGMHH